MPVASLPPRRRRRTSAVRALLAAVAVSGLLPTAIRLGPTTAEASSTPERTALSHTPVAYWQLGESSGDFADSSGNGNTAAAHGGIVYGRPGALTKGGATAVSLDGSTGYAQAADSPSLDRPTTAITLEGWVKPDAGSLSGGNFIYVIQKAFTSHTPPYYQYGLSLIDTAANPNATDLSLSIGGSDVFLVVDHSGWSYGVWNHIAGTYDGTQMRIYVNGSQVGSLAQAGSLDHYAMPLDIGAYVNFPKTRGYLYSGEVEAVAVYASALTAKQVQNDSAYGLTPKGRAHHRPGRTNDPDEASPPCAEPQPGASAPRPPTDPRAQSRATGECTEDAGDRPGGPRD